MDLYLRHAAFHHEYHHPKLRPAALLGVNRHRLVEPIYRTISILKPKAVNTVDGRNSGVNKTIFDS